MGGKFLLINFFPSFSYAYLSPMFGCYCIDEFMAVVLGCNGGARGCNPARFEGACCG